MGHGHWYSKNGIDMATLMDDEKYMKESGVDEVEKINYARRYHLTNDANPLNM